MRRRSGTGLSKLKSMSVPRLGEVLEEGLEAWTSVGRDAKQFFRSFFETELAGHGSQRGRVGPVVSGR